MWNDCCIRQTMWNCCWNRCRTNCTMWNWSRIHLMSVCVSAKVIWLCTVASFLVAFMKTSCAPFASRALELAFPWLKSKAQGLVVVIMRSAPIRDLGLWHSWRFSGALGGPLTFVGLLHLLGSTTWCCWCLMSSWGGQRHEVLQDFSVALQ